MGLGSAGTPPWVDEKAIDEEKHEHSDTKKDSKIKGLEKENSELKKRIEKLEAELKNWKNSLFFCFFIKCRAFRVFCS
jgi:molecular chaperone GrpE (heat shock protein)